MDRGRVGYDLVGNKTIRENALRHKRNCHLERLKKIKNREAGSSKTLDNTVPGSLMNNTIAKNPRKLKIKEDTAVTIQRENRALLQRISLILTAPPKITDADYQKLKKLATRDKVKEKFEKALDEKRNEEIFSRIKQTDAYYHHKQWEDDYARQKAGQKFMRQVTYKRPKGFVDPFAPPPRVEEDEDSLGDIDMDELLKNEGKEGQLSSTSKSRGSSRRTPGSRAGRAGLSSSKSSSHVASVRTLKQQSHSSSELNTQEINPRSKTSPSKLQRGSSRSRDSILRSNYGSNVSASYERPREDVSTEDSVEVRAANKNSPTLLAHVHRHTPLTDGRSEVDRKLPTTDILTDIQCWKKVVKSDEIKENTMKLLDGEFDVDDGESIGSANSFQAPVVKKKEKKPVAIITVRAEILDYSEREARILLSVDKLLQSWKAHSKGNDLPIHAMKNIENEKSNDAEEYTEEQKDPFDQDAELLKLVAREIAAEASLVIESDPKVLFGDENVLRIVLPPHFLVAEVYKREPKKGSADLSSELGNTGPARLQNSNRLLSYESVEDSGSAKDIDYEAAAAEAAKKITLSAENIEIPFACSEPLMSGSSSTSLPKGGATSHFVQKQLTNATARMPKERVSCNVTLQELGDEKASVSVTVLNHFTSSQLRPSRGSAKNKNTELSIDSNSVYAMPLALPSIMTLDAELVQEFFNNVVENMRLFYDRSTDSISLCLNE